MNIYNVLATAVLSTFCLAASADNKVVVVTKQGSQTYDINNVDRIDISGTALKVVATDGKGTTYAFDNVLKIMLTDSTDGLDNTNTETSSKSLTLTVFADGNTMHVNGWNNSVSASLDIYDLNGKKFVHINEWKGQDTDISHLAEGIYILKIGSNTAKFKK